MVLTGGSWTLLATLNEIKSPGPDELHPRVLKELADKISEPLAIICETFCRTGEVPMDWRRANVILIFTKGVERSPQQLSSSQFNMGAGKSYGTNN